MLQKLTQERRGQNFGKTERIQQWVAQEVEIMVSTIEAERSLEQLMEDRAVLNAALQNYKNNLDTNKEPAEVEEHIKQLTNEIEIRSAQIADLQQKISDSDQGKFYILISDLCDIVKLICCIIAYQFK